MLTPVPAALDSVALGSVSDNVLDGYRAVAPHLADLPGAEVLIVSHGLKSVPLYAAQTAVALGAARVDYASDDTEVLALAERLGAHPVRTDFEKPDRRYPIVVDAGLTPAGLRYATRATEPEGTLQSVSFYAAATWRCRSGDSTRWGSGSSWGACTRRAAGGDVVDRAGTVWPRR
jgi:alcohol dehydrogenase